MGSTIQFPRTSADVPLPLAVTPTSYRSYPAPRPCTVRNIKGGRHGVFVWDPDFDQYFPVSAFDRRADAIRAQYDLVNSSDDLLIAETCHECWAVMPLTGKRVRRADLLFCSTDCAGIGVHDASGLFLRIGVVAACLAIIGGWWLGLSEAAMHLSHYFGLVR